MLRVLLLALALPVTAAGQTTPEAIGRSLLNPSWFETSGLELPPGGDAFFEAAHRAYAKALGDQKAPDGTDSIDALARTALDPDGWPDAVAEAVLYGEISADLSLADSALVDRYAWASGFVERLAVVKWHEMSSPHSLTADAVASLLESYTADDMIDQQADLMWYQFHIPLRYALRDVSPDDLSAAAGAYETTTGQAFAEQSVEAVDALAPYVNALMAWTASLAELDMDAPFPRLALPGSAR